MKRIINISLALSLLVVISCRDDQPNPIDMDAIQTGAWARVVSVDVANFDLFNLNSTAFMMTLEYKDGQNGSLFSTYNFYGSFLDNNPGNGIISDEEVLIKKATIAFTTNPENGFLQGQVTVTASEVISAIGAVNNDIGPGDQIVFREEIELTDGRIFSNANANTNIIGGAFFANPYTHTAAFVCPVDPTLYEGLYNTTGAGSTVFGNWPPGSVFGNTAWDGTGTNTLTELENGVFECSDVLGGFDTEYWGAGPEVHNFLDVCGVISIPDYIDQFGYAEQISNLTRDAGTGQIEFDFVDGYGDMGHIIWTRP